MTNASCSTYSHIEYQPGIGPTILKGSIIYIVHEIILRKKIKKIKMKWNWYFIVIINEIFLWK